MSYALEFCEKTRKGPNAFSLHFNELSEHLRETHGSLKMTSLSQMSRSSFMTLAPNRIDDYTSERSDSNHPRAKSQKIRLQRKFHSPSKEEVSRLKSRINEQSNEELSQVKHHAYKSSNKSPPQQWHRQQLNNKQFQLFQQNYTQDSQQL